MRKSTAAIRLAGHIMQPGKARRTQPIPCNGQAQPAPELAPGKWPNKEDNMKKSVKWQRLRYMPMIPMGEDGRRVTASKAHIDLSREAACEGMVLLKNEEHTLPWLPGRSSPSSARLRRIMSRAAAAPAT